MSGNQVAVVSGLAVHDSVVRRVGLEARMPDGAVLVADAWHPAGAGPWPVLLQRLPYGRSVASTPVLPHPAWFARHGYAVVVQDCRGRGSSSGTFAPFVHEAADGAASIEWAAALPFSDGRVVTYGFSYQGLAQLYAAAERPPSLRAIAPMMCCPDPYEGWTYEGGLRRWPFVCFWAAQLAGQDLGTGPVPFDVGALPLSSALGPTPPPWFSEWLDHPRDDEYWAARRPDLSAIDVPVFTVAGWFDDFSSGTVELIERCGAEAVLGPWAHMPWGTRHRGAELGDAASPARVADALVAFFDRVLSGRAGGTAGVQYFSLGTGTWHTATSWPPPGVVQERWSAWSPTGNANSRWGDGVLAPGEARGGAPSVLVAEPLVPYPGDPLDHQDEAGAEDRRDVLVFTSAPLKTSTRVAGSPVVRVASRCDRPSHDLVVTLLHVQPDGTARALTGSGRRVGDGASGPVEIHLRPIAFDVPPGGRLRLDVSGARFPCFDRNPHVDAPSPSLSARDHVVATIEVHDVELVLPVLPG